MLLPNEMTGAEQKVSLELLESNKREREKPRARRTDQQLLLSCGSQLSAQVGSGHERSPELSGAKRCSELVSI